MHRPRHHTLVCAGVDFPSTVQSGPCFALSSPWASCSSEVSVGSDRNIGDVAVDICAMKLRCRGERVELAFESGYAIGTLFLADPAPERDTLHHGSLRSQKIHIRKSVQQIALMICSEVYYALPMSKKTKCFASQLCEFTASVSCLLHAF